MSGACIRTCHVVQAIVEQIPKLLLAARASLLGSRADQTTSREMRAILALAALAAASPKNVLVITIDDLRPWFPPFSSRYGVAAPNLEALARDSLRFTRAFVQQAVCSPSRNSFMSGRRPDTTRVWNFATSFREAGADAAGGEGPGANWTTLPGHFKRAGYTVVGAGKLYHPGHPAANDCASADACPSWTTQFATTSPSNVTLCTASAPGTGACTSAAPTLACDAPGASASSAACAFAFAQLDNQIATCSVALPDGRENDASTCALAPGNATDAWLADGAVALLRAAAGEAGRAPFAAFFGFHKPHPFWDIPEEYTRPYLESVPLPDRRDAPGRMPDVAYYACDSLASRTDVGGPHCEDADLNADGCQYIVPNASYAQARGLARVTDATLRRVRAGYAGGTSWVDAQLGRVLDELDRLGRRDDTLVAVWADHGWALGEHGLFCKQANFELQTRVPLLVRAPWRANWAAAAAGRASAALVELVDLFPTLAELAGAPVDDAALARALEGTSFAPVLDDPDRAWKAAAFSQYPRCLNSTMGLAPPYLATRDPCTGVPANEFTHMGLAMRTDAWRYVEGHAWRCRG